MAIQRIITQVFSDLENVLLQLEDEQYTAPSTHLFNATIGQHVRHILEAFQCLLAGCEHGVVNYDKRPRNRKIETDRHYALDMMHSILLNINQPSVPVMIEASFGNSEQCITIESNLARELVYNLEHAIHHMALIRVGINELTELVVDDTFGVAPSTIQHRAKCAQ